jgi:hypothetical protein
MEPLPLLEPFVALEANWRHRCGIGCDTVRHGCSVHSLRDPQLNNLEGPLRIDLMRGAGENEQFSRPKTAVPLQPQLYSANRLLCSIPL